MNRSSRHICTHFKRKIMNYSEVPARSCSLEAVPLNQQLQPRLHVSEKNSIGRIAGVK